MKTSGQILVLEDDELFRDSLIMALNNEGFLAEGAGSGTEAVELAKKKQYDLIISDVRLPGAIDGIEAVRQIKNIYMHSETMVLIITGYADVGAPLRAVKLGVEDYIHKPFDLDAFLEQVKASFRKIEERKKNTLNIALKQSIMAHIDKLKDIENKLSKNSSQWKTFQKEFNMIINAVFKEIMDYEITCVKEFDYNKLKQMKMIFVQDFRNSFYQGQYAKWSMDKPYGYPTDFKIIDDIYKNNPKTKGYERLFDNYFINSSMAKAIRHRKEDFKDLLLEVIEKKKGKVKILNLASGPTREIKEILTENPKLADNLSIDYVDIEPEAVKYSKKLLLGHRQVHCQTIDVLKLMEKEDLLRVLDKKYDLIYSMGFFDYLSHTISQKILENLNSLMKKGGVILISSFRNRYLNPSVFFIEWLGDWNIVYRDDNEFQEIFLEAGFKKGDLTQKFEQQGILQYISAIHR